MSFRRFFTAFGLILVSAVLYLLVYSYLGGTVATIWMILGMAIVIIGGFQKNLAIGGQIFAVIISPPIVVIGICVLILLMPFAKKPRQHTASGPA